MKLLPASFATALMLAISQLNMSQSARAAEIKVVSGGAFKQVLNALAAQYQKESGNKLDITYQTVGQHVALIRDGKEKFDVAILTPEAIDNLAKEGKVVPGTRADLAKTGVGVVVKAGAPLPDISTVDAFKRTLLAAKSVAYIDPKAGGSSGIYVEASVAAARHCRPDQRQGGIGPWRRGRRSRRRRRSRDRHPPDQRNLGRSRASRWSARCRPKSRISRSMRRASALRRRTARRRAHWSSFWSGPHALPIIKAKGMQPASS